MNRARWSVGILILMLAVSTLLVMSCNEPDEFNADELWKLEDFAENFDYARNTVSMMNRMYKAIENAKQNLGANPEAVPFDEVLSDGWSEESSLPGWYERSAVSGGFREYIRFDHNITPPSDIAPVKAEYYRFFSDTIHVPEGSFPYVVADSVSLSYAADGANISKLQGEALYINLDYLQRNTGNNQFISAGMLNEWQGSVNNLSPEIGNPKGEYLIEKLEGDRSITRIDIITEHVTLPVRMEIQIRSNATGEGTVWVKGEKRIDLVFDEYFLEFHGKATWRDGSNIATWTF